MSTKQIMPKWCKLLGSTRIDCYISDHSEAEALDIKHIFSVIFYDNESHCPFLSLGDTDFCNPIMSWKYAVPVDPALRDVERVK